MDIRYLADACNASFSRTDQHKKAALYGSSAFSVRTRAEMRGLQLTARPFPPPVTVLRLRLSCCRLLAGAVAAVEVRATRHPPLYLCNILSRYKSSDNAQKVWRLFGWYTALVFVSSVAGAAGSSSFLAFKKSRLDYYVAARSSGTSQSVFLPHTRASFSDFISHLPTPVGFRLST